MKKLIFPILLVLSFSFRVQANDTLTYTDHFYLALDHYNKKRFQLAENEFKNEGRIFEGNFAADDEKCSYSGCPHLQSWEARAYALKLKRSQLKMENVHLVDEEGLDSTIKELPSLSSCSRCRLARYCSRECQVSDYKNHKSLCISAGLRKQL